jgi:hypothetical protein
LILYIFNINQRGSYGIKKKHPAPEDLCAATFIISTSILGILATLVYVLQSIGDPTPTENALKEIHQNCQDDIKEIQQGYQKGHDIWRNLLADEAAELRVCRAENAKLREIKYDTILDSPTTETMGEHSNNHHCDGDI